MRAFNEVVAVTEQDICIDGEVDYKTETPMDMRSNKVVWLLLFSSMVTAMGQTITFIVLPLLGREVLLKEFEVGVIISASAMVFAISTGVWGRYSEFWGRKTVITIGLLGYSVGTILFAGVFYLGLSHVLFGVGLLIILIITRMMQSVVMGATNPAATAYIADITSTEERTSGMVAMGAAFNVGTILGPAIGGFLAAISLLYPLYFAALISMIAAALVIMYLPESPRTKKAKPVNFSVLVEIKRTVYSYFDRRYSSLLIVGSFIFMAYAVMQQTIAYYYQDMLLKSTVETASFISLGFVLSAITALCGQILLVQKYALPAYVLIRAGLVLVFMGFCVLIFAATSWAFLLCLGLIGLGVGLAMPGFGAAASMSVSAEEQGSVAGVISASPALGFVIGPLLGTGLYQLDPQAPYIVTAALCIPVMIFAWGLPIKKI